MQRIFTLARTLGIGRTGAMLVGYGKAGEWVVGIPITTDHAVRWALQGVSKADRNRLEAAAKEINP